MIGESLSVLIMLKKHMSNEYQEHLIWAN